MRVGYAEMVLISVADANARQSRTPPNPETCHSR
jgi:hypothetical protein